MKYSLKKYNTFAVESSAPKLLVIHQLSDIQNIVNDDVFDPDNFLFIGAGSNLLLLDSVPNLTIAMRMKGIEYTKGEDSVVANVAAGVDWHQLVKDSLSKGYYGLENLALIPGLVGAAPIQNIGAYGVELRESFISLSAINMLTGEEKIFYKDDCHFGYRDSYFKTDEGRFYLVTSVKLRLTTAPKVHLEYQALKDALSGYGDITPQMVFTKVCEIRKNKLPDPELLGNAGSFFKNPIIESTQLEALKQKYPDIVAYPQSNNNWKVAAGWLIDKAGLKGYRQGDAAVHTEQALVLVNYGKATGDDIAKLAIHVQQVVEQQYSILLEPEVSILGPSGVVSLESLKK